jgi:hypothetical protein
MALIPARLSNDQSQVGVDHPLLGGQITALDPLGQLDLFARRQKRIDPSPAEEQRERVRSGRGAVVGVQLRPMGGSPPPDLPGGSRISAGTSALAGLFDLVGIVFAAMARLSFTTIFKTVQFRFSW